MAASNTGWVRYLFLLNMIAAPFLIALSSFAGYGQTPRLQSHVGIFRQGFFWILDTNGNQQMDLPADLAFPFGGVPGDIPITGDWNGDGFTKVGIYRPMNGLFILDTNGNGVFDAGDQVFTFAGAGRSPGDIPVVGDWNGDGRSKIGFFRQGFLWVLDYNGDGILEQGVDRVFGYGGMPGDVPIVGDWAGTGISQVGIVRQGFLWILDVNGNETTNGALVFPFGGYPGDVPVAPAPVSGSRHAGARWSSRPPSGPPRGRRPAGLPRDRGRRTSTTAGYRAPGRRRASSTPGRATRRSSRGPRSRSRSR